MPRYAYQGLDAEGKRISGQVEADSLAAAVEMVEGLRIDQVEVHLVITEDRPSAGGRRVGTEDLVRFNTQLAAMARAGVPLDEALSELVRQMRSGRLREAIETVTAEVREGVPLAEALARHERVLPPDYVQMVRAGLAAGNLPELLLLMNQRLTLQQEFSRQMVDAFMYPLIVCGLAIVVAFYSLALIRPSYPTFFYGFGMDLPAMTEAYLWLSERAWLLLAIFLSGLGAIAIGLLASIGSRAGRRMRQAGLRLVPYYRRLRRTTVSGQLCSAMAMFLKAGLTVPQVLRMASHTAASERLGDALLTACGDVESGQPLAEALAAQGEIPRMIVFSVGVAESRGDLPETLEGLAEMYRRQGERTLSIARVVLPLTGIALAGLTVGFAAFALFLPLAGLFRGLSVW